MLVLTMNLLLLLMVLIVRLLILILVLDTTKLLTLFQLSLTRFRGGPIGGICCVANAP